MTTNTSFIFELCQYLNDVSEYYYSQEPDVAEPLPSGKTVKIMPTQLLRGMDGIAVIADPSPMPDRETGIQTHYVSFWCRNKNANIAFEWAMKLYNLLHTNNHYQTTSYFVYQSFADGQPEDQDRDAEGSFEARISFTFLTRFNIS